MKSISIYFFILLIIFCNSPKYEAPCDPESKTFLRALSIKNFLGDKSPFCGISSFGNSEIITAPSNLNYSNMQFLSGVFASFSPVLTGSQSTFSVTPSLPAGVTLNTSTGILSGTYSSYFGAKDTYTITASNASGTVNFSASITFFGQLPPKTNQTQCWDSSGTLDASCLLSTSTGQDGAYQKGTSPSFTGPTLVGSDYITNDNIMGVVWNSCNDGKSGAGCATGAYSRPTWANANIACETTLNSANSGTGYAGIKNWRLPTPEELETLVNFNASNPATFSSSFPNTIGGTNTWHWTSLPDPGNPTINAWWVYIADGQMGPIGTKTTANQYYVRCISSGTSATSPGNLLIDNNDGTVTDINKSLVWQKCSIGLNSTTCSGTASSFIWSLALTQCNNLSLAGKKWRLPNINEAKTLLNRRTAVFPGIIDSTIFPSTQNSDYWTSSTDLGTPALGNAWVIQFSGSTVYQNSKFNPKYVRCVADL